MRLIPESPRARKIFLTVLFGTYALVVLLVAAQSGVGFDWPWVILGIVLVFALDHVIILLHELGHAAAAWLLGMRVFGVRVGRDKVMFNRMWGGVTYEIHWLPFGGFTNVGHRTPQWLRTRHMVMVAAGPAVTLA